jgi:hypothetical protein
VFQHGQDNRSDAISAFPENSIGVNGLYMIRASGGTPVRLDHAAGGAYETRNGVPRMSPFDSGGYFWMAFDSRRPYGNAQVGTAGAMPGSRIQVWIAAIHRNPDGTTDPSEVGYWLPGQDTRDDNGEAAWVPRACRVNGTACSSSWNCCSGTCAADASGARVCQPLPVCRAGVGDVCGGPSDCCAPLHCNSLLHVCAAP